MMKNQIQFMTNHLKSCKMMQNHFNFIEINSNPRLTSEVANSTMPVLSHTLSNARGFPESMVAPVIDLLYVFVIKHVMRPLAQSPRDEMTWSTRRRPQAVSTAACKAWETVEEESRTPSISPIRPFLQTPKRLVLFRCAARSWSKVSI